MNQKNKGYVYLMQGLDYIKIGYSKNPEQRLYTLNRQTMPFEIQLIATLETLNPRELEQSLHKKYSKYRVRKEWFLLPEYELKIIIEKYNFKVINNYIKRGKVLEYNIMKYYAMIESVNKQRILKDKKVLQVIRDVHREEMRKIQEKEKKNQLEQLIYFLNQYKDSL